MTVTVPEVAPLARRPDVELLRAGTWNLSTGPATFSAEDLTAAVAALGCPAVRRPVLKIGHTDPRFDGEPAVGWVDNLATAADGSTLVGDYVGMPGWLGDVLASAYPDRSIEGEFDHVCQKGHTHPFVVHAVALLGVTAPGVGSLESLQDVARLYGVAAASDQPAGTPVSVLVHAARKDPVVPNPQPRKVAASVTADDVTRAFYASPLGSSWDAWIEELQLDPPQVIYVDDATASRFRVPVVIGAGDGVDAVSFGTPVAVVMRYEDVGSATVAASAVRYASRAESRPDAPAPAAARPVTAGQAAALCQRLGLQPDTDGDTLLAALDEVLAEQHDTAVTVAASARESRELAELRAERAGRQRDETVRGAVRAGKITPAEAEFWRHRYDAAPEVVAGLLAGMKTEGRVPLEEIGHSRDDDRDSATVAYDSLFGATR